MDYASILKLLSQGSHFGYGFVFLGCSSRMFNVLGMVLVLGLGLKIFQFDWHSKCLMHFLCEFRGKPRKGIFSDKNAGGEACDNPKIAPLKSCPMAFLESPNLPNKDTLIVGKEDSNANHVLEWDGTELESYDEDEEFNVMALRKMVKIERRRAKEACAELEKERIAAASAAEEAMAMILRLQNEKSSLEIQVNQYRRIAEQKQEYDQEVIQWLQWIIMRHESDKCLLEDQLRVCRQKLKQCIRGHGVDLFADDVDANTSLLSSTLEDGFDSLQATTHEPDSSVLYSGCYSGT